MGTRITGHRHTSSDLTLRVFRDPADRNRRTAHLYWKRDLANPERLFLIPWCQIDEAYPDRHPRDEVELRGFRDANWCPGCTGLGA